MPFTASLAENRGQFVTLPCSDFLAKKTWEKQNWEVRRQYCMTCPARFRLQPSCSLDFLTVGDSDAFKVELAELLLDFVTEDPSWSQFAGARYEVDLAYHRIGLATPLPKAIMENFIDVCLEVRKSDAFWRFWNYSMVEGFEGRPEGKKDVPAPVRQAVDLIFRNLSEPGTYHARRLNHLYAAAAIFYELAKTKGMAVTARVFAGLLEASRGAVILGSSLEVS